MRKQDFEPEARHPKVALHDFFHIANADFHSTESVRIAQDFRLCFPLIKHGLFCWLAFELLRPF